MRVRERTCARVGHGRQGRGISWTSGGIDVCRVVMAVDMRCGVAWCCVVWRGMFGVGRWTAIAVRLWRRELWVRRTDAVHDVKEAPDTVTVDPVRYMAPPWHRHSRREEGADHAVGQDVCRGVRATSSGCRSKIRPAHRARKSCHKPFIRQGHRSEGKG